MLLWLKLKLKEMLLSVCQMDIALRKIVLPILIVINLYYGSSRINLSLIFSYADVAETASSVYVAGLFYALVLFTFYSFLLNQWINLGYGLGYDQQPFVQSFIINTGYLLLYHLIYLVFLMILTWVLMDYSHLTFVNSNTPSVGLVTVLVLKPDFINSMVCWSLIANVPQICGVTGILILMAYVVAYRQGLQQINNQLPCSTYEFQFSWSKYCRQQNLFKLLQGGFLMVFCYVVYTVFNAPASNIKARAYYQANKTYFNNGLGLFSSNLIISTTGVKLFFIILFIGWLGYGSNIVFFTLFQGLLSLVIPLLSFYVRVLVDFDEYCRYTSYQTYPSLNCIVIMLVVYFLMLLGLGVLCFS